MYNTFNIQTTVLLIFLPRVHVLGWNLYPLTKYIFHDLAFEFGPKPNAFKFRSIVLFISLLTYEIVMKEKYIYL